MTSRAELDHKLLTAVERLGRAVRAARQEVATQHQLSLLQMQIIEHLSDRPDQRVGALAEALDVTQPTISDAIKVLEAKGLTRRRPDSNDRRASVVAVTAAGVKTASRLRSELAPILEQERDSSAENEAVALQVILEEIKRLQDNGVITYNRSCLSCMHYQEPTVKAPAQCLLLKSPLRSQDLRVDCDEHQAQ